MVYSVSHYVPPGWTKQIIEMCLSDTGGNSLRDHDLANEKKSERVRYRAATCGRGAADGGHSRRQLVELAFGPAWVGDLVEHGEELIERPHGNLLAIWLPGIDSEILPRRNPAARPARMFYVQLLHRGLTLVPRMYRALNSPGRRGRAGLIDAPSNRVLHPG